MWYRHARRLPTHMKRMRSRHLWHTEEPGHSVKGKLQAQKESSCMVSLVGAKVSQSVTGRREAGGCSTAMTSTLRNSWEKWRALGGMNLLTVLIQL